MKSYSEVSSILADTYAQSQLNAYMGGSNQYEVCVSVAAQVLALTFDRNFKRTERSLQNQVTAKFNRLLKEQARKHPNRFHFVDNA